MAKYRAVTGLNYPDGAGGEKRVEAGDTFDDTDLPTKKALNDLLAIGAVEKATGSSKAAAKDAEGGEE